MNTFFAYIHCIKATKNKFVILHSLNMVCGICCLLYLVLSLTGFTHQSQSTKTNMMTSLKKLVIDNSRSTVSFNSTMLRKLFDSSANRPGMEYHDYGSLLFFMHIDMQCQGCCPVRLIDFVVLKIEGLFLAHLCTI